MKCHLCGQGAPLQFLDLGQQPLANKYPYASQFETEDFFPLSVFFCPECKNVQLGTMVSRARMFEDYYYLSSVNAGLVRHFDSVAEKLAGSQFVVDIGSNDGILLKPLAARGVKALGIEPSKNVSRIANDQGLETLCAFFDQQTAQAVKQGRGPADVIVASSVFTHLEDPHAFIEAVKVLLSDNGRFIIEVEYIGNMLRNIQFERFYLDRIFYYSLTSLKHLFELHGMTVTDVAEIEPHGGSLQVTVQRAAAVATPSDAVRRQLAEEEGALTAGKMLAFRASVDAEIAAFRQYLKDARARGLRVGGYGAPARLSTICNYGKIGPELISFTVDDSPLKHGKHTPGTHIPIVTRQQMEMERPDVLVIFAYEYFDDIRRKVGEGYRYVMPIPVREVA